MEVIVTGIVLIPYLFTSKKKVNNEANEVTGTQDFKSSNNPTYKTNPHATQHLTLAEDYQNAMVVGAENQE